MGRRCRRYGCALAHRYRDHGALGHHAGVQGVSDSREAIRLAHNANDFLAREVQKRPDRYAGFAHLTMQDAIAATAELERAVRELGFRGALINGQTNGHYLDEDQYGPFWERVQELDVPVYLHPGSMADHPAMFTHRPELDGPIFAWTADTAAHALRLVFGGTLTRCTKVKIILGHMGETLPVLLWRFDSWRELDLGDKLAPDALPSAIIKRNIAITTSGVCDAGALLGATVRSKTFKRSFEVVKNVKNSSVFRRRVL